MKKTRLFLAVVFVFLLLGVNQVSAIDAGNLTNFKVAKTMDSATFTDVKSGNWFYLGVKTAYDNTIMDGVGGGLFLPNGSLTEAQAITIAARVHAIYQNKTIADYRSNNLVSKVL